MSTLNELKSVLNPRVVVGRRLTLLICRLAGVSWACSDIVRFDKSPNRKPGSTPWGRVMVGKEWVRKKFPVEFAVAALEGRPIEISEEKAKSMENYLDETDSR